MARNLFDHLKGVTKDKIAWSKLQQADKDSWSSFMINRWFSMEPELVESINDFQQYSGTVLSPSAYYTLLFHSLPKHSFYLKYIKKSDKIDIDPKFIDIFCKYYQQSKRNIYAYIRLLSKKNPDELISILQKYGTTLEDITLFKKQLAGIK